MRKRIDIYSYEEWDNFDVWKAFHEYGMEWWIAFIPSDEAFDPVFQFDSNGEAVCFIGWE